MKKLMIALAVAAIAVASQAASFTWKTDAAMYAVDFAAVGDNGSYGNSASVKLKSANVSGLTAHLALYDAVTGDLVIQQDKAMKISSTGNKANVSFDDSALIEASTTYKYVLSITGTFADLTGKVSDSYDYTAAKVTWTSAKGDVTSAATGDQTLTTGVPTSWTVSGVVAKGSPTPTPEPTSGVLLLIGIAGLALRRRRA